jgi:UDP-N-acetylmuramoyl-tripeptide--D-alanyl-D-alanine ligase
LISLSFDQLAQITGGKLRTEQSGEATFAGVSIDSRTVSRGELFVAIKGENNDGHDYLSKAVGRGAAGLLIEYEHESLSRTYQNVGIVQVENSHEALITLAAQYRDKLDSKFIGITGSNGKTTTKELTFRLLQACEPNTFRSPGNFNNLFGTPLSLLSIPQETAAAVMEIGISTLDEMPRLAKLVHPEIIVLTNVGPSHLEFLHTVADVARAKLELVRNADSEAAVIINADDPVLMVETKKLNDHFLTFGIDNDATFTPDEIVVADDGVTEVTIQGNRFRLPLVGKHQVYNLLAAYAVTKAAGYNFADIDTAAIELATAPMRGQIENIGGITIMADCYNANPESMRAALAAFRSLPEKERRILFLGDMLELGEESERYHIGLGSSLTTEKFDQIILVGPQMKAAAYQLKKNDVVHFGNAKEAAKYAREHLQAGDLVLVKASRGIGLEAIIYALKEREGVA